VVALGQRGEWGRRAREKGGGEARATRGGAWGGAYPLAPTYCGAVASWER
jgi:hypothetical protein